MSEPTPFKVEMKGITQKFGSVTALENVDFCVRPQTIHALLGENGAGKTTLMRILYGALNQTEGNVLLDGEEKHFRNQTEAIHSGVGMVSQHYSIIPELTALQNLMLGEEPGYSINQADAATRADELAKQMDFEFDWLKPAEGIGPAQAQKLEILKLLWRKARIMILDEPTAMLSPQDSDLLYTKLRGLVDQGATVIVVTHRLPEVMEYCDEVTVLRGGKLIGELLVSETNQDQLTEMIVGHSVDEVPLTEFTPGETLLKISNLTVLGDRGENALKTVSFDLYAGEVVGLAGVDGNGQSELFETIAGLLKPSAGSIELAGKEITQLPTSQRYQNGLRIIPEDRLEEAIIADWSVEENSVLGMQRLKQIQSGLTMNKTELKDCAEFTTTKYPTKFDSIHQRFGDLSGGNQQKVVNARALLYEPKVVLAFQPTRGIDVHVTSLVYESFIKLARSGATVLVVAFDIDELLEFCDRIIVINRGEVSVPPPGLEKDRQEIGKLMVS